MNRLKILLTMDGMDRHSGLHSVRVASIVTMEDLAEQALTT